MPNKNVFAAGFMKLVEDKGSLKAYTEVITSGAMTVKNFKVIEGPNGLFVAPPQEKYIDKKTGEEKWADIAEVSKGFQKDLNDAVLPKYEAMLKKKNAS